MLPPILKEPSTELFHQFVKGEVVNRGLSGAVPVANAKILKSKDNRTDLAVVGNPLVEIVSQARILPVTKDLGSNLTRSKNRGFGLVTLFDLGDVGVGGLYLRHGIETVFGIV